MKPTWAFTCALALVWTPYAIGQTTTGSRHAAAPAGISVEDVMKLAKAGLSEDIIVEQIRKKNQAFDLTTDQLIALKTAGVSDRIVTIMLDPSKSVSLPVAPVERAAMVAPPLEPQAARSVPAPGDTEPILPSEIGVYARNQNQWAEVEPEIVYWKTAGVLKTVATAGIMHGDVNGRVPGVSSQTGFRTPLELLVVAPEGVVLAEYQLIRLRPNKDSREFRTVTGGVFHSQSGAFRDMLNFDSKKLASRTFRITFPSSAGPGEYGLLPPGSGNGSGKIYTFRISESAAN
jgi:hypothetical protein